MLFPGMIQSLKYSCKHTFRCVHIVFAPNQIQSNLITQTRSNQIKLLLLLSMFVSFICGLTADQGVRKELECLEMYERKEL